MQERAVAAGFVGLGLMGGPMARRYLGAAGRLTVWNRSPEKARALAAAGAVAAPEPAGVAEASEIVFSCLYDAEALESVLFGPGGIAGVDGSGRILVDHSTIAPDDTRKFAARLAEANGMAWVDAPVSGGTAGAEAGTLAVMAGGAERDWALVAPLVAAVAGRATHVGPVGSGQVAKLCNQVIVTCNLAVIAEALNLARQSGIEPERFIDAIGGGFADSRLMQVLGVRMLERIEHPVGTIANANKDVDLVLDAARAAGAPVPMSAAAGEIYRLMVAQGDGGSEFDRLYRFLGGGRD